MMFFQMFFFFVQLYEDGTVIIYREGLTEKLPAIICELLNDIYLYRL